MKAYQITKTGEIQSNEPALKRVEIASPQPSASEVRIKIDFCGICHTELDEIEGRAPPNLPIIPGHQIVGVVNKCGSTVDSHLLGKRVGIAWIGQTCGVCHFCLSGLENLCAEYKAIGKDINGGYAEYACVDAEFIHEIPDALRSEHAAPLLCAGAIAYRSLSLCDITNGENLGFTGFGSSGKIAFQLASMLYPDSHLFVFARSVEEQEIAKAMGAFWVGNSDDNSGHEIAAIIDTTPVWKPMLNALQQLAPNGRLIVNAISKLTVDQAVLQTLDFHHHLWKERMLKSVANVTRKDVKKCLELIAHSDWRPEIQLYNFENANQALLELKTLPVIAAKVLKISGDSSG